VVASIDPELLENLIDMEEIDAESVEDCTDESVMEFLESTQERDPPVTAEFVKAEVLAKVTFAMSENDPALRVTKAFSDYYLLHTNLGLDWMDKSELKKDFFEFITYLRKMAIIHDEHFHVVEHKKSGDSGMKNTGKSSDAGSRSSGHNSGGSSYGGARNNASDRDRTKSGHGRLSDSTCSGKQSAREPPPCFNIKKCMGEKHYLSACHHTGKDEDIVLLSAYKTKERWRQGELQKVGQQRSGD
jgi:hypothetical protein